MHLYSAFSRRLLYACLNALTIQVRGWDRLSVCKTSSSSGYQSIDDLTPPTQPMSTYEQTWPQHQGLGSLLFANCDVSSWMPLSIQCEGCRRHIKLHTSEIVSLHFTFVGHWQDTILRGVGVNILWFRMLKVEFFAAVGLLKAATTDFPDSKIPL